jgi:hypothetical protein
MPNGAGFAGFAGANDVSVYVLSNANYSSSSFKYVVNDFASMYQQYNGVHSWHTTASGTAGNAITFTQAMTLDASGNLLVGATAVGTYGPNGLLISKANVASTGTGKNLAVYTTNSQAANIGGSISLGGVYTGSIQYEFASIKGAKENSTDANAQGYLAFQTTSSSNSLVERMRIHSSGGVSIGNTTDSGAGVLNVNASVVAPFAKLTANGTGSSNAGLLLDYSGVVQWQIYPETTTGTLTVTSAGTTRLKLDTSGNLGLGVTPFGWSGSAAGSMDLIGGGSIYHNSTSNDARWGCNLYITGGANTYKATNFASTLSQADGSFFFASAPSGTAGTTATLTTKMTLDASGGLKTLNTIGVGNATPSTSGAGITFPATQSASTDANTLDDYEEGTYTVTVATESGSNFTLTASAGSYTKIGNVVTVRGSATYSARGSGSIIIISLPFAPNTSYPVNGFGANTSDTGPNYPAQTLSFGIYTGATMFPRIVTNTTTYWSPASAMYATGGFNWVCTYQV